MEIVTMESVAFKMLVEKIDHIAAHIKKNEPSKAPPQDEFVGNDAVMAMLSISASTLYRMRRDGEIEYSIVRGKCRYSIKELERLAEQYKIVVNATTINEMRSNYEVRTNSKGGSDGAKRR